MNLKRVMLLSAAVGVIAVLVWLLMQQTTAPIAAPKAPATIEGPFRATLTAARLTVDITPKDTNVVRSAAPPDGLRDGDIVTTGSEGAADLVFQGNNQVHLEANTSVVIGAKGAQGATLGAVLLAGSAKIISGHKNVDFRIGTPMGVVQLPKDKLAEVAIRFDEGVKVLAGEVNLTTPQNAVGQVLLSGQEMKLDGLQIRDTSGKVDGLTLDVPSAPPPKLAAKLQPHSGRVHIRVKGAPAWRQVAAERPLVEGDTVRVGRNASARVALDDAMGLQLGPRSLFALQTSVAAENLHQADGTLSGGPAEVAINAVSPPKRARVTVDKTMVTIAPTAQAASVEMAPGPHKTAVLVRFGEAKLPEGTVVHAGDIAYVHNGVLVGGPQNAYPDAPEAKVGEPTEVYYDKAVPPVRFVFPRRAKGPSAPKQRMQWSRKEDFSQVEAAEDVAAASFARDRLPEGRSFFRSTDDPSRIGELRVEPDSAQTCETCRPENIIDDLGERVVLHYESRVPRVRLRWDGAATEANSTLYVFSDEDLKKPLVKQSAAGGSFDIPEALLQGGAYHWYVDHGSQDASPKGAKAVNTLKLEREPQTDGLMIATPRLSLVTPKARLVSVGQVAHGAVLTLNGRPVAVNKEGAFRVLVRLKPGQNRLIYRVREPQQNDKIYLRDVTLHH